MSDESDIKRKCSRHWLRSFILATSGALLIVAFVQVRSHFCEVYLHGWGWTIFRASIGWLWLFVFLVLRWRERAILLIITALVPLSAPHINVVSAQVLAGASEVGVLRQTNDVLAAYKNDHPDAGFPTTAPAIKAPSLVEWFYRLAFTPVRARPGLPVEDYILTGQPTRCCCGLLSFGISRDGRNHFTTEDRQATLYDKILGWGG